MPLGVKKLCYDACLPTRGSDGAVGYDLYSSEAAIVPCQAGRALVGTGIALSIPDGLYGRVAPRSGLAVKHCINVGAGVIDPDYTVKSRSSYSIMVRKTLKSRRVIVSLNSFWRGVRHL